MVSGHLRQKKDHWYIVLNLKEEDGKRKQKWLSTGLKIKGNKKRAEKILYNKRVEYTCIKDVRKRAAGIHFDEYMLQWLHSQRHKVSNTTYDSYTYIVKNAVVPYFCAQKILLSEIKAYHINEYYHSLLKKGLSPNTVIRHHANLHKALVEAYKNDLIINNVVAHINPPKRENFVTTPYTAEECNQLLKIIKGEKLETVVTFAVFTGLRRSEILGLKWKAIDFKSETMYVSHSITRTIENGKYTLTGKDKLKRASSFRTLPLMKPLKDYLLSIAEKRYKDNCPNPEDYICVDEKELLIKPNYVSQSFAKLLKKHELRPIRFHDLRHSCANILITARVPLIEVQQWMGHSNISTTADMYGHLSFETKLQSAEIIKKN
jgi:Site-specific recombinase XerD